MAFDEDKTKGIVKGAYRQAQLWYGDALLGVFLYGSQNYNINTENSDYDIYAVYIPTILETVLPIEKRQIATVNLTEKIHIQSKSIQDFVMNIVSKPSIHTLEWFWGKYNIINPKYEYLWDTYFKWHRVGYCFDNVANLANSMEGMKIAYLKKGTPKAKARALNIHSILLEIDGLVYNPSYVIDKYFTIERSQTEREAILAIQNETSDVQEEVVTYNDFKWPEQDKNRKEEMIQIAQIGLLNILTARGYDCYGK